jgi:hypothetical protein
MLTFKDFYENNMFKDTCQVEHISVCHELKCLLRCVCGQRYTTVKQPILATSIFTIKGYVTKHRTKHFNQELF